MPRSDASITWSIYPVNSEWPALELVYYLSQSAHSRSETSAGKNKGKLDVSTGGVAPVLVLELARSAIANQGAGRRVMAEMQKDTAEDSA